ncbi:MAG: arsenate reductase family protein [Woeseiaceae bacterium]
MKVTVHGLKNCDTCRKAVKWLDNANREYAFVDVRQSPPTSAVLKSALATVGVDKLVNKRSTTWRSLSESERALATDGQALSLLEAHPTLMKRPLLVVDTAVTVGFDPADPVWQSVNR